LQIDKTTSGRKKRVGKKLAYSLTLLTILLISSVVLAPASAADYNKVGVKIGDTATYNILIPGQTYNTLKVSVENVVGTLVNLNLSYYNPNGALDHSVLTGLSNVSSGQNGISLFLICANLSAHEPFVNGTGWPTINETISMTKAGATRTVNHLDYNVTLNHRFEAWWDTLTGLMVEAAVGGPYTPYQNYFLTSTSLWSPSSSASPLNTTTLLLIVGTCAIVVVLIVGFVAYRHRKRAK
jgi:hypothetical protein